jgi:hypothetical protein
MSDYEQFLQENGLTEEKMQAGLAVSRVDWTPQPGVLVLPSRVGGNGLFAIEKFEKDETISTIFMDGFWRLSGRYTNHASVPNATVKDFSDRAGKVFGLVALKEIFPCEEITVDYRQVKAAMAGLRIIYDL